MCYNYTETLKPTEFIKTLRKNELLASTSPATQKNNF